MTDGRLTHLTSNQFYGGLNRRFERRRRLLSRVGWIYKRVDELGIAVFVPTKDPRRPQALPAAFVLTAPNRLFADALAQRLQRSR